MLCLLAVTNSTVLLGSSEFIYRTVKFLTLSCTHLHTYSYIGRESRHDTHPPPPPPRSTHTHTHTAASVRNWWSSQHCRMTRLQSHMTDDSPNTHSHPHTHTAASVRNWWSSQHCRITRSQSSQDERVPVRGLSHSPAKRSLLPLPPFLFSACSSAVSSKRSVRRSRLSVRVTRRGNSC